MINTPLRWIVAVTLCLLPGPLLARESPTENKSLTSAIQLDGLSGDEAAALKAKVVDAQKRLRDREPMTFELLSGAPASYPMAEVAPRDAFIALPLDQLLRIERKPSDTRLWQPYRLLIVHEIPGKMLWDVEVVLDFYGQIERIEMLYRPPAPF